MTPMRKLILIGVVLALTVAGGVAGIITASQHRTPRQSTEPAPTTQPAPSSAAQGFSTSPSSSSAEELSRLSGLQLTAPGAQVFVDTPARVTLENINGATVYADVTVHEISAMPAGELQAVTRAFPSLSDVTAGYQMGVSLTVLGLVDGAELQPSTTGLNSQTMSRFTIATHPGSNPLLNADTLSSAGCVGLPAHPTSVKTGDTLTWCVHAFARPGDPAPIGGQYQALTGPFATPVLWASKTFTARPVIP